MLAICTLPLATPMACDEDPTLAVRTACTGHMDKDGDKTCDTDIGTLYGQCLDAKNSMMQTSSCASGWQQMSLNLRKTT